MHGIPPRAGVRYRTTGAANGATMIAMPLVSWLAVLAILTLPALSVVGAWLGARKLSKRADVPRFVRWAAFTLVVPGAAFIALGLVSGLLVGFGRVSGEAVEPSQKARRLAEGISEAMNCGAVGFLFAVVAALWLGFCAWRWGRADRQP